MLYHRKMKLIFSMVAVLTLATLIVIQSTHILSTHAAAASSPITLSGSIGAHDPSRITKDGNGYYVYATGYNIPSLTSTDRIHWSQGPAVLTNGTPAWAHKAVPGNDGHDVWAPDVIYNNGLFYLYYAVSGGKESAIGLVTSPTLNPHASNYKWTDRGEVIGNTASDRYSTIDPAPFFDASGNMWLSWGSGYVFTWSDPEVFVIRLNKSTGLRADNTLYPLENGHIEASYVQYHNGFYYLFWNTGGCCSGTASTYLIHVARSSSVTGPYVDKSGKQNGSDTFLASSGNIHGPGQIGILIEGNTYYYTYHYYNASGYPVLGEAILGWGSDGWPTSDGSGNGGGSNPTPTPVPTTGSGFTPVAGAHYRIVNHNSGLVIDVTGKSTANGTLIEQWTNTGGTNQEWSFVATHGGYKIVSLNSGLVLDDPGGSKTTGTKLDQWSDTNGSNQWWNIVSDGGGYYSRVNQSSGLRATVSGASTSAGAAVIQSTGTSSSSQQWSFVRV